MTILYIFDIVLASSFSIFFDFFELNQNSIPLAAFMPFL